MTERHLDARRIAEFDGLASAERQGVLQHASRCAACRERFAADDASRLFALLALAPIPHTALDELSRRVQADLDRETGGAGRRSWLGVASIAASLFVAAIFLGYSWTQPSGSLALAQRQPIDAPSSQLASAAELPGYFEADEPMGQIQLISSPGDAQVLDLTVGDTQVVMIFDEALDI